MHGICQYHNSFIHSTTERYLACSKFGLLKITVLQTFCFMWEEVFNSFGSILRHSCCFLQSDHINFIRNCRCVFQSSYAIFSCSWCCGSWIFPTLAGYPGDSSLSWHGASFHNWLPHVYLLYWGFSLQTSRPLLTGCFLSTLYFWAPPSSYATQPGLELEVSCFSLPSSGLQADGYTQLGLFSLLTFKVLSTALMVASPGGERVFQNTACITVLTVSFTVGRPHFNAARLPVICLWLSLTLCCTQGKICFQCQELLPQLCGSQLETWDPVSKNNIIFKANITNSTNFLGPKLKNEKVKFIASPATVFKITLKQISEFMNLPLLHIFPKWPKKD